MGDLGLPWPPTPPLRTERLVLREPVAADRAAYVELHASAEVYRYLGGPPPRDEVESALPATPRARPGLFVVERDGELLGTVSLSRREPERPGRVLADGGELELSYLFLPHAWGQGYAGEAAAAVLGWTDAVAPDEPVVLCTQVANGRSVRLAARLGFAEVERFEEFGAEQWFGVRRPR